jgi:hypothetical protein
LACGDQDLVVGLLDRGEVVRGLLHMGEQILEVLVPWATCGRLQGRYVHGGARGLESCIQHGGGVEVQHQHQDLEEGEGWETMTTLQPAHLLASDVLIQELRAALRQRLL